ncbi:regulatory protein RecX [Sphingomonas sp. ac-8]|uniref:regulatory protein RecX n=1 Tax=Sphingomonas sp. ac-8 TaxID=3242977 RepID=UPI003A8023D0
MSYARRATSPPKPLDAEALERLALRYVERYATTRARLRQYLARKLRERGWEGAEPPPVDSLAERMAELRYVDDRAFAESKAAAMGRRGLGARRVGEALRHAGVQEADREAVAADSAEDAVESALRFAKRRRIGPFSASAADPDLLRRQVAAFVRAGHAPSIAWTIARLAPGADPSVLIEDGGRNKPSPSDWEL